LFRVNLNLTMRNELFQIYKKLHHLIFNEICQYLLTCFRITFIQTDLFSPDLELGGFYTAENTPRRSQKVRGFNKAPTSQGERVYIIKNAQSYDRSHSLVFYYIIHTAYRATGSQRHLISEPGQSFCSQFVLYRRTLGE